MVVSPADVTSTRERILQASEKLLAERGVAGMTMRRITGAARVNVASVNYYFGSKDELVRRIVERRLEPINRRRLESLAAIREASGGEPLEVEQILDALFRPVLEAILLEEGSLLHHLELLARSFTEPHEVLRQAHARHFRPLVERFREELERALPGLEGEEVFWQLHLAIASMVGALVQHRKLAVFSEGRCDATDPEGLILRLIAFAAGGIRASATQERSTRLNGQPTMGRRAS